MDMLTHRCVLQPTLSKLAVAGLGAVLLSGWSGGVRADPSKMIGTWIDHTGRGAVEFSPCGGAVCGRIVWMKEPVDAQGKPYKDGLNPNPSLRANPVCGLQIIGDAKPQGDGSLDQGWIYNPEDGAKYSVEVKLISPNILRVHGYMGMKVFGETFTWKRATGSLARCAT
jgi:uncharacterized protein (DUF2147 family)